MAKVLDEQSRKAVAATVRYYRELGIYDLYRREVPEGMTFGQAIVRQELAAIGEGSPAAEALTVDAAASAAVRCRCRATGGDPRRQARCPARDSRRDWRLQALRAMPGTHQHRLWCGRSARAHHVCGRGTGRGRRCAGRTLCGPRRTAAQQHDYRHGHSPRRCVYRQRGEVPPAEESRARSARNARPAVRS